MQICIFEDSECMNLEPIVYSRPVFDLVCGINTLKEKILRQFPKVKYSLFCRDYIAPVVRLQNPGIKVNTFENDSYLFINGSILASEKLKKLPALKRKSDTVYKNGNKIIAAFISGKSGGKLEKIKDGTVDDNVFEGIPVEETDIEYVSYLWDLINLNGSEIRRDFSGIASRVKSKKKINGKVHNGAHLLGKKNIIIEKGAEIKPGAVIDASNGPVYIDKGALVFPNSVIEGPAYIGKNSLVKTGAFIHDNVSICETCKIGGEVEDAIFLPYSNKQHAGFIGHAYIGSWVNFGADTNCSDLKNNYGNIKTFVNGKLTETGSQFLGLIMGDHSKSAINTMFNTGTNTGFSSNVFGAGFPSKFIPSFSWGGAEGLVVYDLDKALDVAKKVMARRNKIMGKEEEDLFVKIFELTKAERSKREIPG